MRYIFIDTTELFNDPMLNSHAGKILRQLAVENMAKIIVSRVVVEELKRHTIGHFDRIDEEMRVLRKKYSASGLTLTVTKQSVLSALDSFFSRTPGLEIVEFPNASAILTDLLERNLHNRKPFNSGEKDSMRDALIWASYKNYAEEKMYSATEDCVFITANTKDFSAALLREWPTLKHFNSVRLLIPELLRNNKANAKLYDVVVRARIDEEYIRGQLEEDFTELLNDYLRDSGHRFPLQRINPAFRDSEAERIGEFRYGNVTYVDKYVSGDNIFVAFNVIAYQSISVSVYNLDYEDGIPMPYGIPREYELELEVQALGKYDETEGLYDCEIDQIDLVGSHPMH